MRTKTIDVAILGGGAAGLAAAREARRREASVVIVNDGPLGGDCTFTGCVPSKTVIESAAAGASFGEAFDRARHVVKEIASTENADVLRAEGVDIIEADGVLVGPGRLRADDTNIEAKGVVLALGSRPSDPPIVGLDRIEVLTSENLWDLRDQPGSIAVIGGGAIGCELGQALSRLGVETTVIEFADRLLVHEEPEAGAIVERALSQSGVDVRTGTGVQTIEPAAGGAELSLSDGTTLTVERVVVAAGRQPNSDRGDLAAAGLELDERGYVATGDDLTTSMKRVFAAGDVAGKLQFTHAADNMGRIAAGNILRSFPKAKFKAHQIPWVTFTQPEVGRVGLSEAQAHETVKGAMVAELPLEAHDRALAANATNGYIKLIAAPNPVIGHAAGGRLVGATVVADRGGELIAELALALKLRIFLGQLATTVHPYPTWSYGIPKAAAQFFTTIEGRRARPARG